MDKFTNRWATTEEVAYSDIGYWGGTYCIAESYKNKVVTAIREFVVNKNPGFAEEIYRDFMEEGHLNQLFAISAPDVGAIQFVQWDGKLIRVEECPLSEVNEGIKRDAEDRKVG